MNLPHLDLQLGWVDIALLAVFGLSVLIGLWRGFVFEIVSLLGWLVAFIIANSAGPFLAGYIPLGDDPQVRLWGAYIAVFVVILLTCTLLARMLRALVSATPLSFIDHLLGGLFGMVRGALILVVAATVVTLVPAAANSTAWKASHGALWLGMALEGLKPVLPQSLNVHIHT